MRVKVTGNDVVCFSWCQVMLWLTVMLECTCWYCGYSEDVFKKPPVPGSSWTSRRWQCLETRGGISESRITQLPRCRNNQTIVLI